MADREPWELKINGQTIMVPGDYVLVRRDVFTRIAKAFKYIAETIDAYEPDPHERRQRGLIFARCEASDAEHVVGKMAETEGTTGIWTSRV